MSTIFFPFLLVLIVANAQEKSFTNWLTGEKVNEETTITLPAYTDQKGKLTINGWVDMPTGMFKLRMNSTCSKDNNTNDGLFSMKICSPENADCGKGMALCYVGQLDPNNNPDLSKQFMLNNDPPVMDTFDSPCDAKPLDKSDWKGKVRHGIIINQRSIKGIRTLHIQATYSNKQGMLKIPMPDSVECVEVHIGRADSLWYTAGAKHSYAIRTSKLESMLSNGALLSELVFNAAVDGAMMYALPLDMLAGVDTWKTDLLAVVPGIGKESEACEMSIAFEGDNLVPCYDKECKSQYVP